MTNNAALLSRLLGGDPYEGFNYQALPFEDQGWGFDNPILYDAIRQLRPSVVIEVGSWKGATAIRLAKELKAQHINGSIICVDTWLGAPEHFVVRNHPDYFPSLKLKHGYPQLYYQFLANVLHSGAQDIVVPLAQTSFNAARILHDFGVRADLIYLDGSHEYLDVYADLKLYWQLLTDQGVVLGDDYHRVWPGVVSATKQFAKEHGLGYSLCREKFVFSKSAAQTLPGLVPENNRYWDGEAGEYRPL